jgi:lysozyme
MTERCLELVKKFEGFSPVVYLCPAGYPTIGYGHVVTPEEMERFKAGITRKEAEELLKQDLYRFEAGIKGLLKEIKLNDYCLEALISFSYNVGLYAFKASTLRKKILRGELLSAADEFLKWVYAGGRRIEGLMRRRQAERALFLEGVYA